MKSIRARFYVVNNKNQSSSSFLSFVEAIRGKNFTREAIAINFAKYIDRDDYCLEDKKLLIDHCVVLTKLAVDRQF